ncbi:CHAP domain-containing protein [Lactococcus petauri]|uniref:CHAP domain-containing protein n=1 Tax=Lactococcus petauri TaxID=1940789 RepID=UPI0025515CC6|nr:CHAP domain-containing protein [Lactococcus petauri]
MKKIGFLILTFLAMMCWTQKAKGEAVCVYKLYNKINQEFLYTVNKSEYKTLANLEQVWVAKGQGFEVSDTQNKNFQAVYRYYNVAKGYHVLTQNKSEGIAFERKGWTPEGIAFFSPNKGKLPVYRVKNKDGGYRYPADKKTKKILLAQGWSDDGIAWYQDTEGQKNLEFNKIGLGSETQINIPEGFEVQNPFPNVSIYEANNYPWGQCTWYVYNRARQLGIHYDLAMGNGGDWGRGPNYEVSHVPQVNTAVSFNPGQAGADQVYGHVAFVEQVRSDGSILISESNVQGLGIVSYRTFSAAEACQFRYIIGRG